MSEKIGKYIVITLDLKHKEHDGRIFLNLKDAQEFVAEMLEDELYFEHGVIGFFADDGMSETSIQMIETFGFDKKQTNKNQLSLFKS